MLTDGSKVIFLYSYKFQAEFNQNSHAVYKCDMPQENVVVSIYVISATMCVLLLLYLGTRRWKEKNA